jgi:hypothetical protein
VLLRLAILLETGTDRPFCRYSRASFEDQGNLQLQPELPWHSAVEEDNSVSIWVEPGSTHTGYSVHAAIFIRNDTLLKIFSTTLYLMSNVSFRTNVDHTIALLSAAASPPLEAILSSTIIVQVCFVSSLYPCSTHLQPFYASLCSTPRFWRDQLPLSTKRRAFRPCDGPARIITRTGQAAPGVNFLFIAP